MKLTTSKHSGFTLLEIMIIVSLIGLLAALSIPNFVRAVGASKRAQCINSLRQLDSAVQQWVLENKRPATARVTLDDCTPYLRNAPICPAGGKTTIDSYSVTDAQTPPKCITSGGGAANGHVIAQ